MREATEERLDYGKRLHPRKTPAQPVERLGLRDEPPARRLSVFNSSVKSVIHSAVQSQEVSRVHTPVRLLGFACGSLTDQSRVLRLLRQPVIERHGGADGIHQS